MREALRVLFVTPYYPPAHLGGIERAIQRLAVALKGQDTAVHATVLTTRYSFPPRYVAGLPARDQQAAATVVRWSSHPKTPAPLFPYYSCPVTWFGPSELGRLLAETAPDVIHLVGDGWVWAHLWLLALRAPETALVFTPSYHRMTPSRQWLRLPNRLLCARSERTIVLTSQEYSDLTLVYHAPPERLRLVPWGVDLPPPLQTSNAGETEDHPLQFASAPCFLDEERPPLRILCVGRLGRHKGQRWLLETYAEARRDFRRPTRLVLVGKDEGDEAALRDDCRRLGLQDDVELLGEIADAALQEQYAQAGVFALFSQFEAFGLVFLEAMAAGLPVLTHRLGAGAGLLTAGAVVTAPFARAEAAAALARLVNDGAWRRRLGEEGRALVQTHYSWERCATSTLLAYQEALRLRRSAASGSSPQV